MPEGLHRQVEKHGRLRRALRSGLGLPWSADRNQGRSATGEEEASAQSERSSARVPQVRAKVSGPAARAVQAHWLLRPLGPPVLDNDARVRIGGTAHVLLVPRARVRLQGTAFGLLVHL